MGLREDALRRILSLDARRSAEVSLRAAQDKLQARAGAVVAIDGERYVLFATTEPDDADLARIARAWLDDRRVLLAGDWIIHEDSIVVPIGEPVVGLLYLGGARTLAAPRIRDTMEELGDLLGIAISLRDREPEAQAMARAVHEAYLLRTPMKGIARDRLELLLRSNDWNKTRVARLLGTTRATVYKWIAKHGLSQEEQA
jgi:hypothetical protein